MKRVEIQPRENWQKIVEEQGLYFHTSEDGTPYWNESAYYEFTRQEIDQIEKATYALNEMCLAVVQHVIDNNLFERFQIPPGYEEYIIRSWEEDEHSIYGRFDFCFQPGKDPMLFEYNADTPTALLEASVIQWHWLKAVHPAGDQFNSIHDRLMEVFQTIYKEVGDERFYFAALKGHLEDYMTVQYLKDVAVQAGFGPIAGVEYLDIDDVGWNNASGIFTDLQEREIKQIFKLYPWEWLMREQFGPYLRSARTKWWEPPWKSLLSNKALLPTLWELYPNNTYLLAAYFDATDMEIHGINDYVKKPILAREGANIAVFEHGVKVEETEGPYTGPAIYQELWELPNFDGHFPVIGSWIVNGWACGIGIREDGSRITQNMSRFVPHIFGERVHYGS
jgi:glutathionylspermidine synthase